MFPKVVLSAGMAMRLRQIAATTNICAYIREYADMWTDPLAIPNSEASADHLEFAQISDNKCVNLT